MGILRLVGGEAGLSEPLALPGDDIGIDVVDGIDESGPDPGPDEDAYGVRRGMGTGDACVCKWVCACANMPMAIMCCCAWGCIGYMGVKGAGGVAPPPRSMMLKLAACGWWC